MFAVGAALVMVLGYSMCFYTWVLLSMIGVVGGYFGVWLCGFWVLLGLVIWLFGFWVLWFVFEFRVAGLRLMGVVLEDCELLV